MNWRTSLRSALPASLVAAGILAAVSGASIASADGPPTYSGTAVTTITGTLIDTTGKEIGAVQASQDAKGVVQIRVNASGLTAGEHGIHIHATGKCEGPAFTTANAHFNPSNKLHGLNNPAGHHAGDLPGLTAAANGTVVYTGTTSDVSLLSGATSIFDADGSALVIHAAADDQITDPSGNSGARIACAVLAAPLSPPATGNAGPAAADSFPVSVLFGSGLVLLAGGALALRRRAN